MRKYVEPFCRGLFPRAPAAERVKNHRASVAPAEKNLEPVRNIHSKYGRDLHHRCWIRIMWIYFLTNSFISLWNGSLWSVWCNNKFNMHKCISIYVDINIYYQYLEKHALIQLAFLIDHCIKLLEVFPG